jgi:anti-anti-sigma factor
MLYVYLKIRVGRRQDYPLSWETASAWAVRRDIDSLIVGKGRIVSNFSLLVVPAAVERQDLDGRAARIIVQVTGEVDVATSALLAATVAGEMEDWVDLVIDLAHVRFIDASGINVLVNAAGQARARGGTLVLRSPSSAVRLLLDILHLDGVLAIE